MRSVTIVTLTAVVLLGAAARVSTAPPADGTGGPMLSGTVRSASGEALGGVPVSLAVPALLDGGAGHDRLDARGGEAGSVLLGAAGNDTLVGGVARDVLIGGVGSDVLRAGVGGALLIADQPAFEANALALARLADEWRGPQPYLTRVGNLSGLTPGPNAPHALTRSTVRSDASVDQLFGAAGLDWFMLNGRGLAIDRFAGFETGEEVTWL